MEGSFAWSAMSYRHSLIEGSSLDLPETMAVSEYDTGFPDIKKITSSNQRAELRRSGFVSSAARSARSLLSGKNTAFEAAVHKCGIEELDNVMKLQNGQILEICGASLSGKTEVALRYGISGTDFGRRRVLFLDSCGQVSAERMLGILKDRNYHRSSIPTILQSIMVIGVPDLPRLMQVLHALENEFRSSAANQQELANLPALIIIDSAYGLISEHSAESAKSGCGFRLMDQLRRSLISSMEHQRVTMIMTNLATVKAKEGHLGRVWQSLAHHRLHLCSDEFMDMDPTFTTRKGKMITASVTKSTSSVCGTEAKFTLS